MHLPNLAAALIASAFASPLADPIAEEVAGAVLERQASASPTDHGKAGMARSDDGSSTVENDHPDFQLTRPSNLFRQTETSELFAPRGIDRIFESTRPRKTIHTISGESSELADERAGGLNEPELAPGAARSSDDILVVPPAVEPDVIIQESPAFEINDAPNRSRGGGDVQRLDDSSDDDGDRLNLNQLADEPYSNYRTNQTSLSWIPGSQQDFGWFSYQNLPYLNRGPAFGFTSGLGVHFVGGPTTIDVPPRLYDFSFGFQCRDTVSELFSYDVATSVGVFSDFESSARDGVRFPSHAVGMFHLNFTTDVVFGVDYLDRDDYAILPVAGVSLRNVLTDGLRLDLIFPRPRVEYTLDADSRIYLAGGLDGGTWDIEYPNESDDAMTYRDYRMVLGFENASSDGSISSWEFGWIFNRDLELRTTPTTTSFGDAFLLQYVWRR